MNFIMILGIDPKVDYAFKKLFGSEPNKSLLIDLLNAVLGSTIDEPLDDVEILNPFNNKDNPDDKLSILDIKARDRSGRLYNIEMQIAVVMVFKQRALYYWSKAYQQQLHEGEQYEKLRRTICINFMNGVLFPGDAFHQEFALLSRQDPSVVFCDDLSIHVIELPKFLGQVDNLRDSLDRWCYFLKYGETIETTAIPSGLRTPSIERAVEVLRMMTQNEIEREQYDSRQKVLRDMPSYLASAREEGRLEELINSLELGLGVRFGEAGRALLSSIRQITDIAKLRAIQSAVFAAQSIDEIRNLVKPL